MEKEIYYDKFDKPELNPDKWDILQFPSGEDTFWKYSEPEAKLLIEDNTLTLNVNPFTKQHPDVSVFDNPKHLIAAKEPLVNPDKGKFNIYAEMSTSAFNNDEKDIKDAFGSFHIMDFVNGMVIDFIGNNKKFGLIYERLLLPGITDENTAFTDLIELRISNKPGLFHKCRFTYDIEKDYAEFFIDKRKMFFIENIPVKIKSWILGIGVLTLDKLGKPLHNQGAEIKVRNIKYWSS